MGTLTARIPALRRDPRTLLVAALIAVPLAAEGFAVTHSYLWAAPPLCLLVVLVAVDIPPAPFLAGAMAIRILTDASASAADARHTAALNLPGGIALLFILVATGLLLRRGKGATATLLVAAWLGLWTLLATYSHGLSTVTVREGVREASILAVFLIVYNSRGELNLRVVARVVGGVAAVSALVALFQFATHTGMLLEGAVRANGTISHPDGAAMLFAIATVASTWRYLDAGRERIDIALAVICGAGAIVTFSLTGLATLLVMLIAFATLRPGSPRLKMRTYAVALSLLAVFLATPLGAQRIARQSGTALTTEQRHGAENTSLAWRLHKWGVVLGEWEQTPLYGKGLGATLTAEGTAEDPAAGKTPHNEYIRYLVETGLVGTTILLLGVAALLRRLWRQSRSGPTSQDPYDPRTAAALGLAVTLGCLFNALTANTLLFTVNGYVAAILVAAALGTWGGRKPSALYPQVG